MTSVALLGGSFDPPHMAHQIACLYLLEAEGFDQVWVIPCYRHAFGKPLAPYEHRHHMCSLMAQPFSGRVVVSKVEQSLPTPDGVNRTVDTVDCLQRQYPEHRFTLVIGSDILPQAPSWREYKRLRSMVPFLVLRRPGHADLSGDWKYSRLVLPDISSSEIRLRVQEKKECVGLLPAAVDTYLQKQNLYR